MNPLPPNLLLALTYAENGVAVSPCRERDDQFGKCKSPYISGGMNSASSHIQQVYAWWENTPGAIIGLPCRANGIVVIDADRHGQEDGVEILSGWFRDNGFNPALVPCVATPNEGFHFIFRRPASLTDTKGKLAPAVDIRDRAYVIAAGSRLADGREYRLWNATPLLLAQALQMQALAEPPSWLLAMMQKASVIAKPKSTQSEYGLVSAEVLTLARLKGITQKVAMAPVGQRNSTLHWAACRLGEMVADRHICRDVALGLIVACGRQIGLSQNEATKTALSGLGDMALGGVDDF
ncbi:hypothetical protein B7H23_04700 [Notoacmeibacter marinus]|uniref:DNA primase/polymerase bifunctional N-terminal domain-containing protein n=1 Tax=Notoacmeibacter marinus TaxID=1876515 RepID=A0A231V201_9HYPH|nr:bifunctional DNA primase/polymerase [Notoacmeibacter marinus]OXT02218.1 hypothetical protein B7H23_04700 [Notoacmeibacter marinus]